MKKIFTLIAAAFMAASVNAQTVLVAYPTQEGVSGTWSISGSTTESSVKIHLNTESVDALKLANGYSASGKSNTNHIALACEGGFKKGDILTIAGASSVKEGEDKRCTAVVFTIDSETKCTALHKFSDFINGRLTNDDPVVETYTLESDYDKIYIGRDGNTSAFVVKLSVTRSGSSSVNAIEVDKNVDSPAYNVAGQRVSDNAKGLVIKNGKKVIR